MHDRFVGCDGRSVSSSVGGAGFCAGAPSQGADGGGGGGRYNSWGGPVHQVVFHLQCAFRQGLERKCWSDADHLLLLLGGFSSCPLSLLLLLPLLLQLGPGRRRLELLLCHQPPLLLLRQLPLLPRLGGQVAAWVVPGKA